MSHPGPRTSHLSAQEIIERYGWVETPVGCWEIKAPRTRDGYGKVVFRGQPELAHRVAFLAWKGVIETGLFVCHSCDNRPCVNPDHLWLGSNRDNMDDMLAKSRSLRGEAKPNTRLTSDQVKMIRQSSEKNTILARRFGVDPSTVSRIKSGTRWIYS